MTAHPSECTSKKMFFTTSDLLQRMNSSIRSSAVADEASLSEDGGFQLQRKMPDGSYRKADEREMAAADFQAKMKQAAEMASTLPPEEKFEWASNQRKEGNALFASGDYREAMDVYLTCLVALEPSDSVQLTGIETNEQDPNGEHKSPSLKMQSEKDIQLPVLLNLALCALKLGLLSKADTFCTYALELESGRLSVKAHFRRGRVRMLMGNYANAELDLNNALNLVENSRGTEISYSEESHTEEKQVVLREKQKLRRLIHNAEKNRIIQKQGMELLFRSDKSQKELEIGGTENNDSSIKNVPKSLSNGKYHGLYPEKKAGTRKSSMCQDESIGDKSLHNYTHEGSGDLLHFPRLYFEWYLQMIGRCAQKLLDIIGDEDGLSDEKESNNEVSWSKKKL